MDNQQITVAQYAAQTGRTWGAVSKKMQRAGIKTSVNMPLTDEIKTIIDGKKQAGKTPAKTLPLTTKKDAFALSPITHHNWVATKEQEVVFSQTATTLKQTTKTDDNKQTKDKKTSEWWTVTIVCVLVSALSVSLTTLGLGMFAQWAGYILGGMFALYLFAAVIVSRNRLKGDTSEAALKTVLYMELGACCLHVFTFYTLLPDANFWLRGIAAATMAGFVAFLSYRAVLFVRYYNAEI